MDIQDNMVIYQQKEFSAFENSGCLFRLDSAVSRPEWSCFRERESPGGAVHV